MSTLFFAILIPRFTLNLIDNNEKRCISCELLVIFANFISSPYLCCRQTLCLWFFRKLSEYSSKEDEKIQNPFRHLMATRYYTSHLSPFCLMRLLYLHYIYVPILGSWQNNFILNYSPLNSNKFQSYCVPDKPPSRNYSEISPNILFGFTKHVNSLGK